MLILGPRQPSNDIDVFLEPLMEDTQKLWEEGVQMMDASLKKFTLKAIIFVTITDYPGLFSLSGQIKGKSGCVVCIDGTCYTYLSAPKKMVYMRSLGGICGREERVIRTSSKEGHTNRGARESRALWPHTWCLLEVELEDRGVVAIRREHVPHEAEVQGRAHPERTRSGNQ